MQKKYIAVIENDTIKQILVSHSLSFSQQLLPDVELEDVTGLNAAIGWQRYQDTFRPPKPHEMAYWDDNEGRWIIPDEYLPEEPL